MRHDLPIDAIQKRLQNAQSYLSQAVNPKLVDNDSLLQKILLEELTQEVSLLKKLLKSPQSFKNQLEQRCLARANDPCIKFLNFNYYASSMTNLLYRDLVQLVFPSSPQKILFPTIKAVHSAEIPSLIPANLSEIEMSFVFFSCSWRQNFANRFFK